MKTLTVLLTWLLGLNLPTVFAAAPKDLETERAQMVAQQLKPRGIRDEAVLAAMRRVPRHLFVPEDRQEQAYRDTPLPIGYGQTISQPYIVAYMTELIRPRAGMRILEIGTGSGYQAAVLAEMAVEVFTVEIIEELARWGQANLERAGYRGVRVKRGDGYFGWSEQAPFDAVVVTAAADHIPPPLLEQLKEGGRMVIPVGSPFLTQRLILVRKEGGKIVTESLLPVRFVPFTRERP
ncbi:MAG: protein-L-isoaspartate(D-aspartate) O-methyltransferase [Deltaproteobacteria bacterium]|nr:protein-L-isoaspartate(D-aspartate) O-methyltransferase [Deltaproteobacteria bacterium]